MAKTKGLGRGLDALFGSTDAADDRLTSLPVTAIRPGKYQPRTRISDEALAELADSIRAQGVIQPVVVRDIGLGDYELIAGERRWRASQLAGLTDIPAVIKVVSDDAALAMALIENIQRQDLDPIEEAKGLKRLIDEFGLTHDATAQAVGRSRSAVSNLLRLLQLPDPVQELLHDKRLEMGHARALVTLPVLQQVALAQQAAEQGWSVREMERRVQALTEPASIPTPLRRLDPDIARLAESLSERLGTRVQIRHGNQGKGKVTIEYGSLDQFETLLEKLQLKSME
ncbi:ParB/RepB/Spo0J family partition protein [Crenobacter sp. SG2303]|uniref:ParB/RepB/Spo0J family partition protein n=1 Tax=Crenobacter oryzisoli TaxID=3056844 RepID=A0ABT7XLH8_9NEIS|nr:MULTISPECIES: ParB/RepB/Spo0J family partition protein [unclassified Crenobacter]MDN0074635.1 ParB/RepB/Spo0J family partition protein [Crenobacter sp. SG2303]MDN0084344.1 ParB/RepB/Spo0J family partition protein [Crenobacter sp. SG2305]